MVKYLVASDLHGSAKYCRELMEAIEREKPEKVLFLGDLLYHGPRNDLPDEYNTKEVTKMLNSIKDKIIAVRGNCDAEVDQMVLEFPMMSTECILYEAGHMIFATHGHVYNEESAPLLKKGDILLHGHTHVPACIEHENYTYINPGSVSLPKEGSEHSYMTLEEGVFQWKTMAGEVYKTFDLA